MFVTPLMSINTTQKKKEREREKLIQVKKTWEMGDFGHIKLSKISWTHKQKEFTLLFHLYEV